jgi:DNA-binding winged helix-turn-helix (wHTH) protein
MQRFSVVPPTQPLPPVFNRQTVGGRDAGPSTASRVESFEFGRFTLLRRARRLLADGAPVGLGTRAFNLLMALVEADGMLVKKQELLSRVWPDLVVEEGNLRVQVSILRKALGPDRDFVQAEFGLGYRFVAPLRSNATALQLSSSHDVTGSATVSDVPQASDPLAIARQLARIDAKLSQALALLVAHPAWRRPR